MSKFEQAVSLVKTGIKTYNQLSTSQKSELVGLGRDVIDDHQRRKDEFDALWQGYKQRFAAILSGTTVDPFDSLEAYIREIEEERKAKRERVETGGTQGVGQASRSGRVGY